MLILKVSFVTNMTLSRDTEKCLCIQNAINIEDIVNEAIVSDLNDNPSVEIDLQNLNVSDNLKKVIRKEFKYIKDLLDFDSKGSHELFRNWYVDGRVYYHKVIDLKKPQDGIQELRFIDALKIKYVRKQKKEDNNSPLLRDSNRDTIATSPIIEEYFEYNPNSGKSNPGLFANCIWYKVWSSKNCKGCDYILHIWSCRQKQTYNSFLVA